MIIACKKIPMTCEHIEVYRGSWLSLPMIGEQVELYFRDESIGFGEVVKVNPATRIVTVEVK